MQKKKSFSRFLYTTKHGHQECTYTILSFLVLSNVVTKIKDLGGLYCHLLHTR